MSASRGTKGFKASFPSATSSPWGAFEVFAFESNFGIGEGRRSGLWHGGALPATVEGRPPVVCSRRKTRWREIAQVLGVSVGAINADLVRPPP
jgi:hypothetical protein